MIFLLAHPVQLLVDIAAILLAWLLHVGVQHVVVRLTPSSGLRWLLPRRRGVGRFVDPFSVVATLIGGLGWAPPLEWESARRSRRGPLVVLLISGAAANLVVGFAALALYGHQFGVLSSSLGSESLRTVLSNTAAAFLLAFGLLNIEVGLLSLVPLPPLDGGRLLFLLAPRTLGWQKAEYQLVDRNFGVAALLVLLIIPLGRAGIPVLQFIISEIAAPIATTALKMFL